MFLDKGAYDFFNSSIDIVDCETEIIFPTNERWVDYVFHVIRYNEL